MRSAKVVHLTSVHGPFDDRIFYKECRSLARAGYEVILIVPHRCDETSDGISLKALPVLTGRFSRMTRTTWHAYREGVRQKAHVYHFHDPEMIPVGMLLRLRGKRVVYDIHEDLASTIRCKYYVPWWLRRPLAWLVEKAEDLACRFFSALTPATPTIAERFLRLNRNTVVLHNYAVLHDFRHKVNVPQSKRPCSVAYVGGITGSRGIREIVQAMSLLPDGLRASLKLAGPFWPANFLDEISHLPGWERVESLGVLDRTGVMDLLANVRAGLLLLHPEPNYIRSKPVKLFEYMCAGIPIIASDFPVWRTIIDGAGCGLLVSSLDPKEIAQAIEYILSHPEEAEAMGRRGREAAEKQYNWEAEEAKLLSCYEDLLGVPPSLSPALVTTSASHEPGL